MSFLLRKFLVVFLLIIGIHLCGYGYSYWNDRSVLDTSIAPFYHGVASGDALQDRVIIWTRVTTTEPSVTVNWRMATDTAMSHVVNQGIFTTDASRDYTGKVDVSGLEPNTYYYYDFEAAGRWSPRGRTKTLPSGSLDGLRIAFMSCSNYSFGYFNAYDCIREENDVDMVIHLGDYIYEDGFHPNGIDTIHRRTFPEYDAYDLTSYRLRYGWYHLDPSLRNLHQQYPMEVIWDDHEFANDAFADTAFNHHPWQGTYANRKKAAIKAFFEWLPVREDSTRSNYVNREQHVGDLADIIYLDSRTSKADISYDSLLLMSSSPANDLFQFSNPDKSMLGKRQDDWLISALSQSAAKWKIVANQVVLSPYVYKGNQDVPRFHPMQGWEAYPYERKRIFDSINTEEVGNIVFITGDIHNAMAFDIPLGSVPYNPSTGQGSAAVEFVCDNITEGQVLPNDPRWMYGNNNNLKFFQGNSSGYCILDLSRNSACCNFWQTDDVRQRSTQKTLLKTLCTLNGENHLGAYCGPSPDPRKFPDLAPLYPLEKGCDVLQKSIEVLGIYPNPTSEYIRFQYFVLHDNGEISVELYDMSGKRLSVKSLGQHSEGLYEDALNIKGLSPGEYLIVFNTGSERVARKLIKI